MSGEALPSHTAERALALQELLVVHATGGAASDDDYRTLRQEFMARPDTAALLPFVNILSRTSLLTIQIEHDSKQIEQTG